MAASSSLAFPTALEAGTVCALTAAFLRALTAEVSCRVGPQGSPKQRYWALRNCLRAGKKGASGSCLHSVGRTIG